MIMAGRGRRLTDSDDVPIQVGAPKVLNESVAAHVPSLIKKISEINIDDISPSLLTTIEGMIKQIFISKEVMKDVLSTCHRQSLNDVEFGEKFIVALEKVLYLEVDGTLVRSALLSLIQNDYDVREDMSQSNPKKFVNSVMLLGNVFNRVKISGKPFPIFALALFDYFNQLLKGEDEELKTLVKQILINGPKLTEENHYKQLMQNLRNTLITRNLTPSSKCWVLLAIELTSNGFQPLKEGVKDFYVTNLGDEYTKLETLIPVKNDQIMHSPVSPDSVKSQDSASFKFKKFNSSPRETNNFKKDLSKKFSDLSLKSGSGKKFQLSPGKNQKKDIWKSSGGGMRSSGQDDRFEKEENFYGVQKPRPPKPENPRKKYNDEKSSRKEFDHFKTGVDGKVEEPQLKADEGNEKNCN